MQNESQSQEGQMALYQITVGDLTYFKSQQWSLTNHVILLLAGIVGITQVLGNVRPWERCALIVLIGLVVAAGLVVLSKLQASIKVRNSRLFATREKLGFAFNESWGAEVKEPERIHSLWILRGAIVLGGLVAAWVVARPVAG